MATSIAKSDHAADGTEVDNGLPKGWHWVNLKDMVENPKSDIVDGPFGSDLKASEYKDDGVPIIRIQNVDRNMFNQRNVRFVSHQKARDLKRHNFRPGDIVITKLGDPVGKACIVPDNFGPGIIVADIVRLRLNPASYSIPYIAYSINSSHAAEQIAEHVKGTTRPRVNLNHMRELKIPLPPLPEQKRIVAKIEELLPKVNAVRERLIRVKEIMKRFRQSVLSTAVPCGGANGYDDDNGENGNSKIAKLSEASESIQIGPFGSLLHRSDYITGGIPVINPTNIADGKIEPSPEVSIRASKKAELQRYILQEGDVIVGRRGEMGRCAVVGKNEAGWICGTGSLFIRPGVKLIPEYLKLQISSPGGIAYLENASVGSTMTNLNQRIFCEMKITAPPIDEQRQTVHRVGALNKLAGFIEKRLEIELSRTEKMTQAILAKAFRGTLNRTENGLRVS